MTLDEVSSLRRESSRQGVFTEFDFVAGDVRQRWVRIPGLHDYRSPGRAGKLGDIASLAIRRPQQGRDVHLATGWPCLSEPAVSG